MSNCFFGEGGWDMRVGSGTPRTGEMVGSGKDSGALLPRVE